LQTVLEILGRFLRPDMAVIETAAGIGAHAVPLSSMLGAAGHLMLYEENPISRRVLHHNLQIAGAANVTIMRERDRFYGLDELGLRRLDLVKINGLGDGETLDGSNATLRKLRPLVFLESPERSRLDTVRPQLEALDYTIRCIAIPYYDSNNFRRACTDTFEGRDTFAMLAIPRERDVC
jgi:hypothetical protein